MSRAKKFNPSLTLRIKCQMSFAHPDGKAYRDRQNINSLRNEQKSRPAYRSGTGRHLGYCSTGPGPMHCYYRTR